MQSHGANAVHRPCPRGYNGRANLSRHLPVSCHSAGPCSCFPSLLPHMRSSSVIQDWEGSDHLPIQLHIHMPTTFREVEACTGHALPQLRWNPCAQANYVNCLGNVSGTYLRASSLAAARGDVDGAFQQLEEGVLAAASQAGMPLSTGSCRARGDCGRHKPFFDAECAALKRQVRALRRRDGPSEEAKVLERQYHSVVRTKRRAHRQRMLAATLQEQRGNPRGFWHSCGAITNPCLPLSAVSRSGMRFSRRLRTATQDFQGLCLRHHTPTRCTARHPVLTAPLLLRRFW